MDLPSPVEAVHRRGAETRVAMHVTGLTSARNCSAVLSVHDTDSHSARYMHVAPISSTSLIISHQVDACSTVTAPRVLQQRQAGAITSRPASVSTIITVQRPGLELVDSARIRRLIFRLSSVGSRSSSTVKVLQAPWTARADAQRISAVSALSGCH